MTDRERFDKAIQIVLNHEGGYVNNPNDPGGETKYGISKRSYPDLDIKNLTLEQAKEIYYRDWWKRLKLDEIQDWSLAAKVLDLAVNMGAKTGIMLLQRAINAAQDYFKVDEWGVHTKPISIVDVDGVIGRQTIQAANAADPKAVLAALRSEAAGYYRLLIARNPKLQVFERGWLNRAYS